MRRCAWCDYLSIVGILDTTVLPRGLSTRGSSPNLPQVMERLKGERLLIVGTDVQAEQNTLRQICEVIGSSTG